MNQLLITICLIAMAVVATAQHSHVQFKAMKTTLSGKMNIKGPVEKVFPLFDPVNESKWIPEWQIQVVYQEEEGVISEGMVFLTDTGESEGLWNDLEFQEASSKARIWNILAFDLSQHFVKYQYVWPGKVLVQVEVSCEETATQNTEVTMTYSLTALSESGNTMVQQWSTESMKSRLTGWEKAVNDYLSL